MRSLPFAAFALVLVASIPARADISLDAGQRRAAVEGLARALRTHYVFPDVGERAATTLLQKLMRGFYTEPRAEAFAAALTEDLQSYTKDRHFRVRFDPGYRGAGDPDADWTPEEKARFKQIAARQNFGLARVEVLPANVGLLDLRAFAPTEFSAPLLTAAMTLLASTDASSPAPAPSAAPRSSATTSRRRSGPP
jgi:hypothetical protein